MIIVLLLGSIRQFKKTMSMKLLFVIPLLAICTAMLPAKKTKIVFFGDSITQMGINKNGYIDRMQAAVNEKRLQHKYELIGAGIGGNKVYDLYLRMEDDVMAKKPNVVVIYVGVNDVWHKTSGIGTDIEKFEKFYTAIIKKLQARKIKVVVTTPACIGELKNNANPQDDDLNKYSDVIRKLSATYNCGLVDLRAIWQQYEEKNNNDNKVQGLMTTDRVHLSDLGNQMVADEMMSVLSIQ
jgi:isoamyl acetate esterase